MQSKTKQNRAKLTGYEIGRFKGGRGEGREGRGGEVEGRGGEGRARGGAGRESTVLVFKGVT